MPAGRSAIPTLLGNFRHAIGYLKGRFQSLKSLRLLIKDEESHKFATYWMLACVVVHNFAMECEAEERAKDEDIDDDPFIQEGLSSSSSSDSGDDASNPIMALHELRVGIAAARVRQEELKWPLFRLPVAGSAAIPFPQPSSNVKGSANGSPSGGPIKAGAPQWFNLSPPPVQKFDGPAPANEFIPSAMRCPAPLLDAPARASEG
ncbi:hypothetical protein GSI_09121 [Ganoderma sinense ZZ0214-1]|uniref:DDE Tnp4 domain-containing protein n=1 Tax=Ganoderma sinense ZZ0214-1 TaxID=1077348 RepID=A0A2G8S5N1_9APHY|nr:hypothetical protein GSI_09121 [Ganoderma sinense ZZ0214-1]